MHDRQNSLAQETDEAEKKRDRMCDWVCAHLNQRHDVKAEIWRLEQELKSMKEELTKLKVTKKESETSGLSLMPVVPSSISELSKGASGEPGAPKKKNEEKRHPGCLHKRDRSTVSHT